MSETAIGRKSVGIVLLSGISKITGLIREVTVAALLGVSRQADLLYLAFQIPNTARRLLSEGMFSSVLVPELAGLEADNPDTVSSYARGVLARATVTGAAVAVLGMVLASPIVGILQPGILVPEFRIEAVLLTRIMFGYLFFMSTAMVLRGLYEHARIFSFPAMLPLLFNIGVLTGIFGLRHLLGNVELAFAVGIVLGGLLQVGVMMMFIRKTGFRPVRGSFRVRYSGLLTRTLLAGLVVGAPELFLVVCRGWATWLAAGNVAPLDYASRLVELSLGISVLPVGMVVLPYLSRQRADIEMDQALLLTGKAIAWVQAICFPAALGLVLLRKEVITFLFARGAFSGEDVAVTASVLGVFSLSVPLLGLYRMLCQFRFAGREWRQSAMAVSTGFLVTFLLSWRFTDASGIRGIAWSWLAGVAVSTAILLFRVADVGIRNHVQWVPIGSILRVVGASLVMGLAILMARSGFPDSHVLVLIVLGAAVYGTLMTLPGPGRLWSNEGENPERRDRT